MYYILYPFFYLVSLLPWRVLYFLSGGIAFILEKWMKYRREVIMNNLSIAFPEKSQQEKEAIAHLFYRNFTDTFIESIKILSLNDEDTKSRFITDLTPINELHKQTGLNVQLHGGHFFNWEFINAGFARGLQFPFLGVYMPIKNKALNKIFYNSRSKSGTLLISATQFQAEFAQHADKPYALGLIADQKPADPSKSYWVQFFGKEVPFVTGPEKGAKLNNTIVVFVNFYKVKRGFYQVDYEIATQDPRSLPHLELTQGFASFLERAIRKRPDNYLWSHKRWKWTREIGGAKD